MKIELNDIVGHVNLPDAIRALITHHGGVRKAARALRVDPAYLTRLRDSEKVSPSASTLRKLGLKRVVTVSYHPLSSENP